MDAFKARFGTRIRRKAPKLLAELTLPRLLSSHEARKVAQPRLPVPGSWPRGHHLGFSAFPGRITVEERQRRALRGEERGGGPCDA